jgi:hypothetical protein
LTTEDGDPDTGTLSEVVVTNRLTVATPERSTPQATPESVGIGSGTNAAGTTVSTSAATTAGTTAGTITAGTDTQMPAIESAHGLFDSIHNSDEKPPIGIIVGAIVGCIALLGLIAAVAFFVSRRSRDSMPTTPQTVQPIPSSSPAASSTMTMTTSPMTFSQVPSGTSEYGAAPVFPPSGEYGVAPSLQPYDSPPPQMFADYESVRDPLQL